MSDPPVASRPPAARVVEAVAVGAGGALLAGAAGSLVGLAIPAAVVGGVNGLVSGGRGIYRWNSPSGPAGFVLDSTWSLPMTTAGLVCHGVAVAQSNRGDYERSLSERADRHVYRRGFRFRKGFLITLGNVVNQAGDTSRPRRRRLVTDHEHVHVWQARWWGPLYPVLYVAWSIIGGAAGIVVWATRRRDERISRVVETCSYYLNPFEWWAYSRDDHWPPTGIVAKMGWQLPAVQSFTARRAGAGSRATPR